MPNNPFNVKLQLLASINNITRLNNGSIRLELATHLELNCCAFCLCSFLEYGALEKIFIYPSPFFIHKPGQNGLRKADVGNHFFGPMSKANEWHRQTLLFQSMISNFLFTRSAPDVTQKFIEVVSCQHKKNPSKISICCITQSIDNVCVHTHPTSVIRSF